MWHILGIINGNLYEKENWQIRDILFLLNFLVFILNKKVNKIKLWRMKIHPPP